MGACRAHGPTGQAQADGKTLGKGEQRIREILPDCRERHLKLVARARLDGAQGEPGRARRFLRVLPLGVRPALKGRLKIFEPKSNAT
jgi:hypothetical protein